MPSKDSNFCSCFFNHFTGDRDDEPPEITLAGVIQPDVSVIDHKLLEEQFNHFVVSYVGATADWTVGAHGP
jgi:hypothetical protein